MKIVSAALIFASLLFISNTSYSLPFGVAYEYNENSNINKDEKLEFIKKHIDKSLALKLAVSKYYNAVNVQKFIIQKYGNEFCKDVKILKHHGMECIKFRDFMEVSDEFLDKARIHITNKNPVGALNSFVYSSKLQIIALSKIAFIIYIRLEYHQHISKYISKANYDQLKTLQDQIYYNSYEQIGQAELKNDNIYFKNKNDCSYCGN